MEVKTSFVVGRITNLVSETELVNIGWVNTLIYYLFCRHVLEIT